MGIPCHILSLIDLRGISECVAILLTFLALNCWKYMWLYSKLVRTPTFLKGIFCFSLEGIGSECSASCSNNTELESIELAPDYSFSYCCRNTCMSLDIVMPWLENGEKVGVFSHQRKRIAPICRWAKPLIPVAVFCMTEICTHLPTSPKKYTFKSSDFSVAFLILLV